MILFHYRPVKLVGVEGFAPTRPLGHRFYRPAQRSHSDAHLLKWLRGPESNRRGKAYETLQRSQHSPRYKTRRKSASHRSKVGLATFRLSTPIGGGDGTCTRRTLLARQHRPSGTCAPNSEILPNLSPRNTPEEGRTAEPTANHAFCAACGIDASSRASRGLKSETGPGPSGWMDRAPLVLHNYQFRERTPSPPLSGMWPQVFLGGPFGVSGTPPNKPIRSPGSGVTYISKDRDKALP